MSYYFVGLGAAGSPNRLCSPLATDKIHVNASQGCSKKVVRHSFRHLNPETLNPKP